MERLPGATYYALDHYSDWLDLLEATAPWFAAADDSEGNVWIVPSDSLAAAEKAAQYYFRPGLGRDYENVMARGAISTARMIDRRAQWQAERPRGDQYGVLIVLPPAPSYANPRGGLARRKGLTARDVDPRQLAMGIKVEREHGGVRRARQTALDHLAEHPDYYTRLKRARLNPQVQLSQRALDHHWLLLGLAAWQADALDEADPYARDLTRAYVRQMMQRYGLKASDPYLDRASWVGEWLPRASWDYTEAELAYLAELEAFLFPDMSPSLSDRPFVG